MLQLQQLYNSDGRCGTAVQLCHAIYINRVYCRLLLLFIVDCSLPSQCVSICRASDVDWVRCLKTGVYVAASRIQRVKTEHSKELETTEL
jgi:hypothetical protein